MKDLCPISLCNVLYKILSKVLTNRLKKCLNKLISPYQSAFVPGRLITNNILSAYKIFHYMKKNKMGKKGYMSVKLDMAKTYDRVEWGFLEHYMRKLGFADEWTSLIMRCASSVSFSVLVEGRITPEFCLGRGLRQGDPLSPICFFFAAGLYGLLHLSEQNNRLCGISIARGAPCVSHLCFLPTIVCFLQRRLVNKTVKLSTYSVTTENHLVNK